MFLLIKLSPSQSCDTRGGGWDAFRCNHSNEKHGIKLILRSYYLGKLPWWDESNKTSSAASDREWYFRMIIIILQLEYQ